LLPVPLPLLRSPQLLLGQPLPMSLPLLLPLSLPLTVLVVVPLPMQLPLLPRTSPATPSPPSLPQDPEHPHTLEQLDVLRLHDIDVDDAAGWCAVRFTPTVAHCSMATLIGLCVKVRLARRLPPRFKVDVTVSPGTHATGDQVDRQLADKERVAAALENPSLLAAVERCLRGDPAE